MMIYLDFCVFFRNLLDAEEPKMDSIQILSTLSQPFWWSSEVIARTTESVSSPKVIIVRVGQLAVILLLSPVTIFLKTVAELFLFFKPRAFTCSKEGNVPAKDDNTLSIFSWNICGLPGGLPRWFGGLPPLSQRIKRICNFILQEDCDIVCLQEAHDVKSTYTLCDQLRQRYKYFYLNIGAKPFHHNSGLIVASKRTLSNVSFTPFNYKGKQFGINKGFFAFQVETKFRIVTTHLQPYSSARDQAIRLKELQEISRIVPDIICGDLNIDRFEHEIGTDHLKSHYTDALGTIETATDSLMNTHKQTKSSSIDYCLVQNQSFEIETSVCKAYDLEEPKNALSDHHALVSKIQKFTLYPGK